jgi:tRNA(Ile)-lysidine synthase
VLNPAPASDLSGVFDAFDLSISPTLIVAVSGGGDSVALLALLARQVPRSRLVAATVDHSLRPESAAEAGFVAHLCAARGIRHVTLRWEGEKPATGLAAAAREARYRLLRQAAKDHDASILLTGHTEDDQAETVAMRAERGEGRGLAGMAPATLLDGKVWLLRPLLGIRRETLRAMLAAEGIEWIDDPSNDSMASERVRTRRGLADSAERDALLRRAGASATERIELGRRAAVAIERHASAPCHGLIRLDAAFIRDTDRPAATYALRLLLATAGGRTALPEEDRVDALRDRLAQGPLRATLSGAVIDARRDGIFVHREARGLPAAMEPTCGPLWDDRFRITGTPYPLPTLIAPTGPAQAAKLADDGVGAPGALIRAALAAEPSLWRENVWLDFLSTVTGPTVRATRVAAPFARYLPSFDLAPARALARFAGGELPPPSPYRGHSAGDA